MSKLKKVLAIILSMAMILGMSLTTFAANNAKITVKGINRTTELTILQVIAPNRTTETGWGFINGAGPVYTSALGVEDEQTAIWMLIKAQNSGADTPEDITAATTAQISKALTEAGKLAGFTKFTNGSTVNSAGIYIIKAEDKTTSSTPYRYTNMSAYVGFDDLNGEGPEVTNVEIEAKGSPTEIEKEIKDDDGFVAFGDIIENKVTSYMPYFNAEDTEKSFEVWDEISGADYYLLNGEGRTATVTMGGVDITDEIEFQVTETANGQKFVINFNDYIDDQNTHGGEEIIITYQAKVNGSGLEIINLATNHINGEEVDRRSEWVTAGWIKLIKYNEDSSEKLSGAGFEVTKDNGQTPLTFTKVADGIYKYDPQGTEKEVFTAETDGKEVKKGELIIYGLDTGKYHFTEKTAPEGYSINQDGADAELSLENEPGAEGRGMVRILSDETSLTDTKLSSLPETGGIGTTIFTVGGCVIMIAAAGLFFASRKKESK